MTDVPLQRKLGRGGAGEPELRKAAQFLDHPLDRGVVPLHVADHDANPGGLSGCDDRLAFGLRKRDRLLHKNVPPRLRRAHHDRLMASRREHQYGVQWLHQQRGPVGEAATNPVGIAKPVDHRPTSRIDPTARGGSADASPVR